LSGGDRSALAFAFFVAQAERDPALANLTLVFDDPYNSQDRSRQMCTQQVLTKLATQARQVIVMSHNPHFLRLLWDHSDAATTKLLQFGRLGPNTFVAEWDVEAETQGQYERDYRLVRTFVNDQTGEPRLVARATRVLLEGYLRLRFIGQFAPNEWLGDFIAKIRAAPAGSPLLAAQSMLEELSDINDFAKRYHHSNPNADTEPIDSTELHGYATRALAVVGGI
jgi:wobble nucleotide-excising tRNase